MPWRDPDTIYPRPRLADSFESWRDWWFGFVSQPNPNKPRETRHEMLAVDWPPYAPFADGNAMVTALQELFNRADELVPRFGRKSIAAGLWEIAQSQFTTRYSAALWEPATDELLANGAISAMYELFAKLFRVECDAAMCSGRSETSNELNSVCYMWFDLIGLDHVDTNPIRTTRLRTVIGTLARVLAIPHVACQESALHGLGHVAQFDPGLVRAPIENFLAANRGASAKLREYAQMALEGAVQ